MPQGEARVIVLYEDEAHRSFMVRLVDHLGLKAVRFVGCVDSTGVLRQLEIELETTRKKMAFQKNLGLVVVVDADNEGLGGRHKQFAARFAKAGGARDPAERIAYVIPAREIETWYLHLCVPSEREVDEARDDYKQTVAWRALAKDIGRSAREAVKAWPPESGREDPASLVTARGELARLS